MLALSALGVVAPSGGVSDASGTQQAGVRDRNFSAALLYKSTSFTERR